MQVEKVDSSHHERSEVVEDVSQGDQYGGFPVELPCGAVLLQQLLLLQPRRHLQTENRC